MSHDPFNPQPQDLTPPQRPTSPAPATGGGGLATGGFVCALVGLALACIPVISIIGVPPLIVGLVLSAVGVSRHHRPHRGLAVSGLVLALVGLPVAVVATLAFGLTDTAAGSVPDGVATSTPATSPTSIMPSTVVPGYRLSRTDDAFLTVLDQHSIPRGDDDTTVSLGHSVCGYLDSGGTPDGSDRVLVESGYRPYDAAVITGASIGAFCPAAG